MQESEKEMEKTRKEMDPAFCWNLSDIFEDIPAWERALKEAGELVAALPEGHPLAGQSSVTWADLASETFLVRHGGTGPQVHSHIVLRHAGRWPAPSILRFDIGRGALLSMVGQGFGITIAGAATSLLKTSGVVFVPFADEPEPVPFSAIWSPFNRSAALRNLLTLASDMGQLVRTDYI